MDAGNALELKKTSAAAPTSSAHSVFCGATPAFLRSQTVAVGLALAVLFGFSESSFACLEPDGSNDALYLALGTQLGGGGPLLSLKVLVPGVGVGYSGSSAAYYNSQYALTAAHVITGLAQYNPTFEISTGSSYLTNRGTVVAVDRVIMYPGFDPNHPGNGPDIAIVHFATPLSGTNAVITNATGGEMLTEAGFGATCTPSTAGSLAKDGNSRGWMAPVDPDYNIPVDAGYSGTYYLSTDFYPYCFMNGKGMSGDSGGPLLDGAGNLIGIGVAQSGNTSFFGGTIYLMLAQPDVYSWIVQNTQIAPLAPTLTIDANEIITLIGQTNQVYGIEASTNLTNWHEIGRATNLVGNVSFQDFQATNCSKRFYRAVVK